MEWHTGTEMGYDGEGRVSYVAEVCPPNLSVIDVHAVSILAQLQLHIYKISTGSHFSGHLLAQLRENNIRNASDHI